MINLISLTLLLISLLGIALIILRKAPVLAELSLVRDRNKGILNKAVNIIKKSEVVKGFTPDVLLHKTLSKVRVLTLKTECKTADWLKDLRQKSIEKKKSFSDDYWKKIKRNK